LTIGHGLVRDRGLAYHARLIRLQLFRRNHNCGASQPIQSSVCSKNVISNSIHATPPSHSGRGARKYPCLRPMTRRRPPSWTLPGSMCCWSETGFKRMVNMKPLPPITTDDLSRLRSAGTRGLRGGIAPGHAFVGTVKRPCVSAIRITCKDPGRTGEDEGG